MLYLHSCCNTRDALAPASASRNSANANDQRRYTPHVISHDTRTTRRSRTNSLRDRPNGCKPFDNLNVNVAANQSTPLRFAMRYRGATRTFPTADNAVLSNVPRDTNRLLFNLKTHAGGLSGTLSRRLFSTSLPVAFRQVFFFYLRYPRSPFSRME